MYKTIYKYIKFLNSVLNVLNDYLSSKIDSYETQYTEMKNKLGKDIFESWIKKIEFVNEFNDYILISVSTRFIRDWITSRYLDQILQIIKSFKKNVNRIEFIIKEPEENKNNQSQKSGQEQPLESNTNVSFIKDSYLKYNIIRE